MKRILALLWLSFFITACSFFVYPVSSTSTPMPADTSTPMLVIPSREPSVTVVTVLPYTSTPSNICGSYEFGRRVYLDEAPAFALRQGPGCEYEAAQSRLFKNDPLTFFDVLGKQGDWLLVDLCSNAKAWAFAPAIDDGNIEVNLDDLPILTSPATPVAFSTPLPQEEPGKPVQQARKTLIHFFDFLYNKRYDEAAKLFSGGYGQILMWNPDVDAQDYPTLLQRACEWDDFQCFLRVKRIIKEEQISTMEYDFIAEFINEDGSLYERIDPQNQEKRISQFSFRVVRDCDGSFLVVDWPFYIQHVGP